MSEPIATSADEPSYEAARAELAEVMKALESGGQSLEDSLELWRRGEELADVCQRWLDEAGRRLDEAIAARTTPEDPRRLVNIARVEVMPTRGYSPWTSPKVSSAHWHVYPHGGVGADE